MSVSSVKGLLQQKSRDGKLNAADVKAAFAEAKKDGKTDRAELQEIAKAVAGTPGVTVDAAAKKAALELAGKADLFQKSSRAVGAGKTLAGTSVPPAVTQLLQQARLAGAVVWDPATSDEYSHYPSMSRPVGNMAFGHTEVTPRALADDMAFQGEMNWMSSPKDNEMTYRKGKGGTGSISANYDEAQHPDLFARSSSGDKWANNFAILADGSLHCLPASRRDQDNPELILTNPSLGRGQQMMFNGHLEVRRGVVVGVEMSGGLSKRAAKGDDVFIDPIALLKAWGFQVAPGLEVQWGNTKHGTPVRDEAQGIIRMGP